jgi:hypothetical protein
MLSPTPLNKKEERKKERKRKIKIGEKKKK